MPFNHYLHKLHVQPKTMLLIQAEFQYISRLYGFIKMSYPVLAVQIGQSGEATGADGRNFFFSQRRFVHLDDVSGRTETILHHKLKSKAATNAIQRLRSCNEHQAINKCSTIFSINLNLLFE